MAASKGLGMVLQLSAGSSGAASAAAAVVLATVAADGIRTAASPGDRCLHALGAADGYLQPSFVRHDTGLADHPLIKVRDKGG